MSDAHLLLMGCGILLIVVGCALVGRRKTIKKRLDPGYRFNREFLPMLSRKAQQLNTHITGLHAQHHRRTAASALCADRDAPPGAHSTTAASAGGGARAVGAHASARVAGADSGGAGGRSRGLSKELPTEVHLAPDLAIASGADVDEAV